MCPYCGLTAKEGDFTELFTPPVSPLNLPRSSSTNVHATDMSGISYTAPMHPFRDASGANGSATNSEKKETHTAEPLHRRVEVCSDNPAQRAAMKTIVAHCMQANTVVEVADDAASQGVDASRLAFELCSCRIEGIAHKSITNASRALLLSPTVPQVKQQFEIAKQEFHILRPCLIIGNSEVDRWGKDDWRAIVAQHNIIISTPQLVLDAPDARHLHLCTFSTLVVNECQHCSGRHPFARIFADHYGLVHPDQIRVLGLSKCLVKPKVKAPTERQRVLKQLETLMNSKLMDMGGIFAEKQQR
jgi:hypothetical protein